MNSFPFWIIDVPYVSTKDDEYRKYIVHPKTWLYDTTGRRVKLGEMLPRKKYYLISLSKQCPTIKPYLQVLHPKAKLKKGEKLYQNGEPYSTPFFDYETLGSVVRLRTLSRGNVYLGEYQDEKWKCQCCEALNNPKATQCSECMVPKKTPPKKGSSKKYSDDLPKKEKIRLFREAYPVKDPKAYREFVSYVEHLHQESREKFLNTLLSMSEEERITKVNKILDVEMLKGLEESVYVPSEQKDLQQRFLLASKFITKMKDTVPEEKKRYAFYSKLVGGDIKKLAEQDLQKARTRIMAGFLMVLDQLPTDTANAIIEEVTGDREVYVTYNTILKVLK